MRRSFRTRICFSGWIPRVGTLGWYAMPFQGMGSVPWFWHGNWNRDEGPVLGPVLGTVLCTVLCTVADRVAGQSGRTEWQDTVAGHGGRTRWWTRWWTRWQGETPSFHLP